MLPPEDAATNGNLVREEQHKGMYFRGCVFGRVRKVKKQGNIVSTFLLYTFYVDRQSSYSREFSLDLSQTVEDIAE